MSEAISHRSPFARVNWDSPASVSTLDASGLAPMPERQVTGGTVVVLPCGCASRLWFPSHVQINLESYLLQCQANRPDLWGGARLVEFSFEDGRKVAGGRVLPEPCTHGGPS